MKRGTPNEIVFAIEGPGASDAAAAFLAIDGLHAEIKPTAQTRNTELLIVGGIFSITASAITIANQLHAWRDRERQKREQANQPPIQILIQVPEGGRLDLETATADQLAKALSIVQNTPDADPVPDNEPS